MIRQKVSFIVSIFMLKMVSGQQVAPSPRSSGLFIYHPASKAMVLLDGHQIEKDSLVNNAWIWNGKKWKEQRATGPGTRSLTAGALDTRKNKIIRFGGLGFKNYDTKHGDTWEFDDKRWSEMETSDIGTRDHHKMVYADHLGAFVLYGGYTAERKFDTVTWLLKGNLYIPLKISGPGPRAHFGMAYDKARKKVVLFGGLSGANGISGDLWEFDGNQWVNIKPTEDIGKRVWHGMVYHDKLKMSIIQGGHTPRPKEISADSPFVEYPTDTWGWNGYKWQKLAMDGPSSILPAIGYDPRKNVLLYYSGAGNNSKLYDFLWEFRKGKWEKKSS